MQLLKERTNFCRTNVLCLKDNSASGPISFGAGGVHVFKKDTGKLEGKQLGGEKAGIHHGQVLLEELRIGSLGTEKHLLYFGKEPVSRSYEVTDLISV